MSRQGCRSAGRGDLPQALGNGAHQGQERVQKMPSTLAMGFRISACEVIMPLPIWLRCPETMFSR